MNSLPERLVHARHEAGFTQEELAVSSGVSQVTIQHLESGRNESSRKLVHIAKALDVSADWLAVGVNAGCSGDYNPFTRAKHLIEARLRFERAKGELIICKAELQASGNPAFEKTISSIEDNILDLESSINKLSQHIEC